MDYGPSLMATVEAGDDGSNIAYKGIAVRLDPGPGGVSRGRAWSLFEHDTLRLAASWTGDGFHRLGRHQLQRRSTRCTRESWAWCRLRIPRAPAGPNPETGSFDDPRPRGRDGRPYGPLPRQWGPLSRACITMAGRRFCRTRSGRRQCSRLRDSRTSERSRSSLGRSKSGLASVIWCCRSPICRVRRHRCAT